MTFSDRLVGDIRCAWRWFTTWLNVIGSAVLTYVLSYPTMLPDLVRQLPAAVQSRLWLVGPAWFILVQLARSIKQKPPGG